MKASENRKYRSFTLLTVSVLMAAILGMVLASCSNPISLGPEAGKVASSNDGPTGKLVIRLGGSDPAMARTILPQSIQAARYLIHLTGAGFSDIDIDRNAADIGAPIAVPVGSWNLTVSAYNSGGVKIGQNTTAVPIAILSPGNTFYYSVQLETIATVGVGTWYLNVSWTWPAAAADWAEWIVRPYNTAVNLAPVASWNSGASPTQAASTGNLALLSGDYWLTIQLKKGGSGGLAQAPISSLVKIYDGLVSSATYNLTSYDLTAPPEMPANLRLGMISTAAGSLRLDWYDYGGRTDTYKVYKNGVWVVDIASSPSTGYIWTDAAYSDGQTASYQVKAVNSFGESPVATLTFPWFSGGSGTQADPWQVASAAQLWMLRKAPAGSWYRQVNPISLGTDYPTWPPIGSQAVPWQGNYDGMWNSISGLNCSTGSYQGLFAAVANSTVRNLSLSGSVTGTTNLGILAGRVNASELNYVSVNSGTVNGTDLAGGIAGEATGGSLLVSCINWANVTISGSGACYGGGFVGMLDSSQVSGGSAYGSVSALSAVAGGVAGLALGTAKIQNLYVSVSSAGGSVGGVVGRLDQSAVIQGVSSSGTINGTSETGGLVGVCAGSGMVQDSSFAGTVTVSGSSDRVGGLIGHLLGGSLVRSGSMGNVTAGTTTSVGGLVGLQAAGTSISQCYASGTVVGSINVGGLVGGANGSVTDSYATGSVQTNVGSGGGLIGLLGSSGVARCWSSGAVGGSGTPQNGFVGSSGVYTVSQCYWDRLYAAQAAGGATGATGLMPGQMVDSAVVAAGWDIAPVGSGGASVWIIDSTSAFTYPHLRWQSWMNVPYPKYWSVRDVGPGGGYVFYDKGSYAGGWRYLLASATDQGSLVWDSAPVATGALASGYGEGLTSTNTIFAQRGVAAAAANAALGYSVTGLADWYLPTQIEINEMYYQLKTYSLGGLSGYYWSSAEYDATQAYSFDMGGGVSVVDAKTTARAVRAVHRF